MLAGIYLLLKIVSTPLLRVVALRPNHHKMRLLILAILFTLSACHSNKMVQTNLYFGQFKLDGQTVKEAEWNDFVKNYVSKVFPDGSTVLEGSGNWYDTASSQLVVEPSRIVMAIYKSSPERSKQIDSLRYWYKTLYLQQSVLRVDRKVVAKLF